MPFSISKKPVLDPFARSVPAVQSATLSPVLKSETPSVQPVCCRSTRCDRGTVQPGEASKAEPHVGGIPERPGPSMDHEENRFQRCSAALLARRDRQDDVESSGDPISRTSRFTQERAQHEADVLFGDLRRNAIPNVKQSARDAGQHGMLRGSWSPSRRGPRSPFADRRCIAEVIAICCRWLLELLQAGAGHEHDTSSAMPPGSASIDCTPERARSFTIAFRRTEALSVDAGGCSV